MIVGGGFGGLTAARALRRAPVQLTLVDRRNHHLFQPLLYQVAMAGLAPTEIAVPIRSILAKQKNTKVLLDEVVDVDLVAKVIKFEEGPDLPYDYLILAPGARTHYFGHDDWAHFAPGLKSIDDAVEIRRRVLLAFEAAEREPDVAKRARLLNFIVIGAGPTGMELAGAIAELARYTLTRDFKNVQPDETHVLLLEGGPRVVPMFDAQLSDKAVAQLNSLGVQVRTDSVVKNIDAHGVTLASGEVLDAETIVWTAGVSSSPLLAKLGVEVDRSGRAKVNPDCSLPGQPEVFVIGDAAFLLGEDGKPLPGVSPTAMQMARHVAKLITQELKGEGKRTPFRYFDKGIMATIGRSRAIAQVGKIHLSGLIAWLAWLVVHLWYLIGFRNRVLVLMDWGWAYAFYSRGARLITGGRLDAGAPERASSDGASTASTTGSVSAPTSAPATRAPASQA
ncbi:MAG: dehydrogenase [Myxococcaceae bacterium]|nr:dehydrogenase [Myxococcaceae bacterium]